MNIATFFANPSAWGIGLALIFGVIWLVPLAPLEWRSPWLWLIFLAGALLFAPSIAWIQAPLQTLVRDWFTGRFGLETYQNWLLLVDIPAVLLSGLVQEGAKLIPPVVYWWRKGKSIDPKLGLSVGAMSGAGFGIVEAQWLHNAIFAAGWSWNLVGLYGSAALLGFWERFSAVAFHTASCALAGYGLAKGWGWQFYLLASLLHFLTNYTILMLQRGLFTTLQLEAVLSAIVVIMFGIVLRLRWRKTID